MMVIEFYEAEESCVIVGSGVQHTKRVRFAGFSGDEGEASCLLVVFSDLFISQ